MNVKMVVHCQRARFDVLIDRTTKWGSPFSHVRDRLTRAQYVVATRAKAIEAFETWVKTQPDLMAALPELRGKVLGCWCDPLPCHGHVLTRLANEVDPMNPAHLMWRDPTNVIHWVGLGWRPDTCGVVLDRLRKGPIEDGEWSDAPAPTCITCIGNQRKGTR